MQSLFLTAKARGEDKNSIIRLKKSGNSKPECLKIDATH